MNKKFVLSILFIFSLIVLGSSVTIPLIINYQKNNSLSFSTFFSDQPSIYLSEVSDVTKTIVKKGQVNLNDYAQFKVDATIKNKINNVEPTYTWYLMSKDLNGNEISVPINFNDKIYSHGQTTNILLVNINNLSNIQPDISKITIKYFCKVSYGDLVSKDSNVATLNLNVSSVFINITKQPQNITNVTSSQEISIVADLSDGKKQIEGTISYQWYQIINGANTPVTNGNSSKLIVLFNQSELLNNISKSYFCKLSYNGLVVDSSIAIISPLAQSINITSQPSNATVSSNKTTSLSVSASLSNPIVGQNVYYQWYQVLNNQEILMTGETSSSLNLLFTDNQMNQSMINYYFCRISYGSISIDSKTVSVTINAPSINITSQPQGFTYTSPSSIAVSANVSNGIINKNLTYQWYEIINGVSTILVNQTSSSLPISYSPVELTISNQKQYFCKLSYNGISIDSLIATILIGGSTINIVNQPQNISVATSSSSLLTTASITNPITGVNLSYQWYQIINNVEKTLTGQNNNVLQLNYSSTELNTPATNQYFCKIIYGNMTKNTNIVTVTIVADSVINSVIETFNAKPFNEKLTLYKALFNTTNKNDINYDIYSTKNFNLLINQTLNNINFSIEKLNEITDKMTSSPLIIGNDGNILFTFDMFNLSNAIFAYQNKADVSTICNFSVILSSNISDINISYANSFFSVSFTLNGSSQGLSFSVFGKAFQYFNYKQTVSYSGAISQTFNQLIKTNLLNL